MTAERIWLLVNKRRSARGREPVTLTRVQRALRLMLPHQPRPHRNPLFGAGFVHAPFKRWDMPAPNDGRPPFKRYGPR